MKKFYSNIHTKATLVVIGMLLLGFSVARGQKAMNVEKAENATSAMQQQIITDVELQQNMSPVEIDEFTKFYEDSLAKRVHRLFARFKKDTTFKEAKQLKYIENAENYYTNLYQKYKQIKAEFPSSIAEVMRHTRGPVSGVCEPACDNIDFEKGDLSGWTACYADCSAEGTGTPKTFKYTTPVCTGPIAGGVTQSANDAATSSYQVSLTSGAGYDPVCGGTAIPVVAPGGGSYSCRIGDGGNAGYGVAFLEQSFNVTAANADFYYSYAVVLENPPHLYYQQPYFNVALLDQNGDTIPKCGNYSVVAGGGTGGTGWVKFTYNDPTQGPTTTYYLPWQNAFVSLKKYIGSCVTVVIRTSDCGQGGHFGYAYFDSKCQQLGIITSAPSFCGSPITLTAPTGGVSYMWTGPCVVGSPTSQTITVGCAGKYTVIIQDVVGASCADTLDTVIVSGTAGAPKPSFKSDTVCAGNPTQFTNTTTGGNAATTWDWYMGVPGDSSHIQNPVFTYPAAGTYTVNLKALNGGCGNDTSFTVVVVGPPTAAFSASTVCLNTPTVFTNTSTAGDPYVWEFGDGTTSNVAQPTHTYAACGSYTVTIKVGIKGCIDSVQHTITVNPNPVPNFTADTVCIGGATQFTDKSTIACAGTVTGWSWKFGDPANGTAATQDPTYTYAATGNYNVTLTATSNNACQTAVTLPVTVAANPVAKFTPGPACLGQATQFTDNSTGPPTTWSWRFGDGTGTSTKQNPSYVYAAAGTYTVTLVVSSGKGCVDSTTGTVTVSPIPTAGFTSTTVCQGTATAFTDTSHIGVSWSWRFGDAPTNGTSTVENPTYTYATAGTFNVTEIVTNASGCKDSLTIPVTVNPNPTATFTVPPVCLGTASVFTLTTTMVGGTFAWTFGDAAAGTSTVQSPTYTYATAGSFNVAVVLTSAAGCVGNATGTAVVNLIPIANFTAQPVCQGITTSFINKSTYTGTPTWAWNFGDGGSSTLQNPTHTYSGCGTYSVMLTVTSGANCTHDTTITVIVNPVPSPKFTATSVCQGLVTTFTDASTIGCGDSVTAWTWSFGDGTGGSTLQNPTHTYATAGIYSVSLKATSSNGCDSTINVAVTVYPLPAPAFTENTPCQGSATNFTDQSTVVGGNIVAWAWRFGDPANSTSTSQNPSFTYPAAGTYTVELTVTSNFGCIDSTSKVITVYPNPIPLFSSDTVGCTPLCVTFADPSSVTAPYSISQYLWNFGDGSSDSTSLLGTPSHCYRVPGTYSVTLNVTTNVGCTATLEKPNYITAWPVPVAKFNASPNPTVLVNNPTVVFTDESTGNPVSWSWFNFGDGKDSVEITENTTHTYTDTGTFVVYLAIKNQFGCVDTAEVPVVVEPVWTFYVPNAFTPNGDGLNDGFIAKGVGILSFEMWIFDRWGMQLYHCTSMDQPWNGTVQGGSGVKCQEDTYVWLIQFTDVFHNAHRYVGRVSIIK